MITIQIIYTKHALEKMDAYGLERSEVETIIKKGMKWQRDEKWHASMYGIEIVFQKENDTIFIITIYPEGRKK